MAEKGGYFNFTDNVAIVTGGSTGIGRATSLNAGPQRLCSQTLTKQHSIKLSLLI